MGVLDKLTAKLGFGKHDQPETVELTEDAFRAFIEKRVEESVGLPLDEFREQLADGRLDPESPRVAELAILVGARAS